MTRWADKSQHESTQVITSRHEVDKEAETNVVEINKLKNKTMKNSPALKNSAWNKQLIQSRDKQESQESQDDN